MSEPVLALRGLRTSFETPRGKLPAVDRIDLELFAGETLGVVGESGCGKSVTALSILRLLPQPPASIEAGEIVFEGRDLLRLGDEEMRHIRGNRIAMIFQEPMTCLNPVFRIGDQIGEALTVHRTVSRTERDARVIELLELVGIPESRKRARDYPHQLSGGMRQRVMIAMALANDPAVLIADEPTTALDVTIQAQILELLERLKSRFAMAVLLITHDLGIVAESAERLAVLYAGRVVETGSVLEIFAAPRHPYTAGLLEALPSARTRPGERLHVIEGRVPDLVSRPAGCSFRERCTRATEVCAVRDPELGPGSSGHRVACHNPVSGAGART
ncbi:MAG: ABC transporter ATP-binding protein [Deltaproteobacteria bacterium]|nr:ABC transporter ATP-binding protein [Deltaproteobacteria bacterium]